MLKVGDKVAVIFRLAKSERLLRIDTVTRLTEKLVITTGNRFYKKTGLAVSGSRHHIVPATLAHHEVLATRAALDAQKKADLAAAEERKKTLRSKFPQRFFPNVADFGDKIELSFECSWEDAERIAEALKSLENP